MKPVSTQLNHAFHTSAFCTPTTLTNYAQRQQLHSRRPFASANLKMSRIDEVAQQIQSAWEKTASLSKPGVHFNSGFARTAVDAVLTGSVNKHVRHARAKGVLMQLSKTAGLAAQISVLKPGAFTMGMWAIIGLGGSASKTVKSLARLLGHFYLTKVLIAVAQGNLNAASSLVASVCGAYAGKVAGERLQSLTGNWSILNENARQPEPAKRTSAEIHTMPSVPNPLKKLGDQVKRKDAQLAAAIDHFLHPNFLLKQLLTGEKLTQIQPALNARVSIIEDKTGRE